MKCQPKPTLLLSSEQASLSQQLRVENLNPERERKIKKAIESSPANRDEDAFILPITDPGLLEIIEREGLSKQNANMQKMRLQHHHRQDKIQFLLGFISRVGVVHTGANYGGEDKRAKGKNRKNSPIIEEL